MMRKIGLFILTPFIPLLLNAQPGTSTYLASCIDRQVSALGSDWLQLEYVEIEKRLYHSSDPWKTARIERRGSLTCCGDQAVRSDTVTARGEDYVTTEQFGPNELLIQNPRSTAIRNVSQSTFDDYRFQISRYSPTLLLTYAATQKPEERLTDDYAIYDLQIDDSNVELVIRRSDNLLVEVRKHWADDMLGDMSEVVGYDDFAEIRGVHYPRTITVAKVHGIQDSLQIVMAGVLSLPQKPLERPDDYAIEAESDPFPSVSVQSISDHLHSIEFSHTESRTLLVEFADFFTVIDVPFSSENGERVLAEARKIAPDKPIRYFAFGHHHPWYLGGVRPFILGGTTVLATPQNIDYVNFLATAEHTIKPDSLQLSPTPLRTELIDSIMTITDGTYQMQVIHIGERSDHTSDYLIFYFPDEKMVMEGDLAWVPADRPVSKPSSRAQGLYNAIREFGLDVETIIQTWPVGGDYNVKNLFSPEEMMGNDESGAVPSTDE